ncbi:MULTISPECIES: hypothetical protein [unclassified Streptomyces]|uniref:hypothetical protein n=1 Tax=unclassified Streptomyces TaxID=2593676 RepID=UPI0036E0087F
MSTCHICARPAPDGLTACSRCRSHLAVWLGEITHQLVLLRASLELGTRPDAWGSSRAGRAHSPLPVRGDVLTLLGPAAPGPVRGTADDQTGPAPVHAVLHAWADQLGEDLGHDTPPMTTHAPYADYLLRHLDHVVRAPWVAALHAELGDVVRRVRAITATEPRRRAMDAPCPHCACFALGRVDWQADVECEACGLLLTPEQYEEHRAAVMPPLARLAVRMVAAHHIREAS